MRVHYCQHVPFEGLAVMESMLRERGHALSATRFYADDKLPALSEIDFLIVMGGPMSVHDEAAYPWLGEEKAFIAEAIAAQRPVLGICLGAQLIASAMGARVMPNTHKEIGWFAIAANHAAHPPGSHFCFPPLQHVFHWHGETFDLPPGAIHLARSEGCVNQAFQLGEKVLGLQFHLEMTDESVRKLCQHCSEDLVAGPYVQSEADLQAGYARYGASTQALMGDVLRYLGA